jgi:lipoate---protein ligase
MPDAGEPELICDLTLPTPAENLACDEALLEACEAGNSPPILRFWEPVDCFVVVGYANKVATEVDLSYCKRRGIQVLRRCSGGGTVLQGPGCLNYSLILRVDSAGALEHIRSTNEFILQRHRAAVAAALGTPVECRGQTDLAIGDLKFSGNSQRRRKKYLLFHGTFLLRMDLGQIQAALLPPSHQPDYRRGRTHSEFLTNLPLSADRLKSILADAWGCPKNLAQLPMAQIARLVTERYGREDWNRRL